MATLTTKFNLGAAVWRVFYDTETVKLPCRDCRGKGWVMATLADESTEQVRCPRHTGHDTPALVSFGTWPEWRVGGEALVLGQIQLRVTDRDAGAAHKDRHSIGENMDPESRSIQQTEDEERYMAWATGVNTGTVYDAADLFADPDEAAEEAEHRTQLSRAGEKIPGSRYGSWQPSAEQIRIAGGFLDHHDLYEHDAAHILLAEEIIRVGGRS